jgi:diguanylate cyclase (GGDEF)-like protein
MALKGGSLGDFIIWMPMITLLFFLILGTKRGLYFSIFIYLINFVIGIMYIKRFSTESIDSLGQFFFASLGYIIVLYYAQHVFKTYADLEMFKKHAYFDSLTKIANRLQIDEWLAKKLKVFNKTGEQFSIIFFDIDHFKKVNDNFGHKVGDEVLTELAKLIQRQLSDRELFGRWGGEEFIIISGAFGSEATMLSEHIRSAIERNYFNGVGEITGSFGVTDSQPGDSLDTLLSRADQGLYLSKSLGRNQVSYIK